MAGSTDENLTVEEIAIKNLRKALGDIVKTETQYGDKWFLLPFLKDQQFNVEKAEVEVRNAIKWRKETKFEGLANKSFNEELYELMPCYLDGVTKDGVPVATMVVGGDVDHKGIVAEYGKDRYLRYFMQYMSKAEKLGMAYRKQQNLDKITATTPTGVIFIMDVSNYSVSQAKSIAVIQSWVEVSQFYKKYYPGIAQCFYILSMNKIFGPVFKLMKPWIEGPNLQLNLYDETDESWKEDILQLIDSDQIRPPFGGTRSD